MGRMTSVDERIVFDTRLPGWRGAPIRFTLASLIGGPSFWFLSFVCSPLGVLAGAVTIEPRLAGHAAGLSALFLLVLWQSSYRYASPQVTIDPTRRTVRIEHERTTLWGRTETIDLDDVETVRVAPLGGYALVRVDYRAWRLTDPRDFPVSRSDLPAVEDALGSAGVDVRKLTSPGTAVWRRFEPLVRVITTPVVLVAVPVYAVREFGAMALRSHVVVVAVVLGAWLLQRQVIVAAGLRPRERPLRILVDVVGTVTILVGGIVAYLQLT